MDEKIEVIQEAWGDQFAELSENIDENGWLIYREKRYITIYSSSEIHNIIKKIPCDDIEYGHIGSKEFIRPKSLSGIEDNNGWIKIESEKDLPEIGQYCQTLVEYEFDENTVSAIIQYTKKEKEGFLNVITYWRPIELTKKRPLY